MNKSRIVLLSVILSLLFSCNSNNDKIKQKPTQKELQDKVLAILKCDSNSDIISISINNLSEDFVVSEQSSDKYNFTGKYVGSLIIKYEGTLKGQAIFIDDKLKVIALSYSNSITSDNIVSDACLTVD